MFAPPNEEEEEALDYEPQDEEESAEPVPAANIKQSFFSLVPKLAAFGFDWENTKWHFLNTGLFIVSAFVFRNVPFFPDDPAANIVMPEDLGIQL